MKEIPTYVPGQVKLRELKCQRQKILAALTWLVMHNPAYEDIVIEPEDASVWDGIPEDSFVRPEYLLDSTESPTDEELAGGQGSCSRPTSRNRRW